MHIVAVPEDFARKRRAAESTVPQTGRKGGSGQRKKPTEKGQNNRRESERTERETRPPAGDNAPRKQCKTVLVGCSRKTRAARATRSGMRGGEGQTRRERNAKSVPNHTNPADTLPRVFSGSGRMQRFPTGVMPMQRPDLPCGDA